MDCHQNDFLQGPVTSARCANHQNAFPRGAATSTRGGNYQNPFLQGAATSQAAVMVNMLFHKAP
uniref:Uncharacterized protein n=1 Tax=Romanomermis culicivorax TaxID=13658 RepID=A0A915JU77_ROMCU